MEMNTKQLNILSFMAAGLTEEARIDKENKVVNLRFAADVDLTAVYPYFYCENHYETSVKPYERMDFSKGDVQIEDWIIHAQQNSLMKEFYVDAVNGSDANSGNSEALAFATLERAKQAVREIKEWTGDVIVHLAKGEYHLTDTLKFDGRDGAEKGYAVLYKGAKAEETCITSGISLKGWKVSYDVPGVKNVFEIPVPEGVEYARDLFVSGKRAILARSEENPEGFSHRQDTVNGAAFNGYTVSDKWINMKNWRNRSDIEFVYDVTWTSNILPVGDVIEAEGEVRVLMKEEPFANSRIKLNCNPDLPTFVQNAFELLSDENEWYFDRTAGKIYYISDGTNPDELDVVLPTLQKLVEVQGNENDKVYGLGFQNIGFKYTSYLKPHIEGQIETQASFVYDPEMKEKQDHDCFLKTPGGLSAAYVEGMRFDRCSVSMMAAAGLDYEIGVVGSSITGSRFAEIGGAGIQIGGVKVRDAQPFSDATYEHGVFLENAGPDPMRVTEKNLLLSNIIEAVGLNFRGSVGIWAGYVRDCTIAHNTVRNIAYSGISVGWGWGIWDKGGRPAFPNAEFPNYHKFDTPTVMERNVIEGNDVSDCMTRLADGAGIYTLSLMPNSVLSRNYIHDIDNGGNGFYLDEGSGGFTDITGNVVYHIKDDERFYLGHPYFHNLVWDGPYFQPRFDECEKYKHHNFFTTGEPIGEEHPVFVATREHAGIIKEMMA